MSQPETVTPLKKSLQPGQAFISGRIHSVRKIPTQQGTLWLSVLKLPAVDQFSHPSTVELRSNTSLGKSQDDWSGVVVVAGMPNNYKQTDKETGEEKTIYSARNELTVFEE